MSTLLKTIQKSGRDDVELTIDQFAGPNGLMLQLTQGFGGSIAMAPLPLGEDEPGYIQLTKSDASQVVETLKGWLDEKV